MSLNYASPTNSSYLLRPQPQPTTAARRRPFQMLKFHCTTYFRCDAIGNLRFIVSVENESTFCKLRAVGFVHCGEQLKHLTCASTLMEGCGWLEFDQRSYVGGGGICGMGAVKRGMGKRWS